MNMRVHAPGRLRRPAALIVTAAVLVAAATLGAQQRLSPKESAREYTRATRSFADGQYEEAYRRYNSVFSDGADGELVTPALKGMIRSALRLSSFQIARREAEALRASVPADVEAMTLFGDAQWGSGLFDEAEATYQSVRDRDPNNPRARFGVARSIATRGRLEEALAETVAAATTSPTDPEILVLVAELNERLFRYDEAARVYQTYVKLLPSKMRNDPEVAGIKIQMLRAFNGRTPGRIDGGTGPFTVPFKMRGKQIVLAAALNGHPVDMVLDTGADRTAITRDTASRVGVKGIVETMITGVGVPGIRGLSVGRADSLSIGDLTVHDLPVSIRGQQRPGSQDSQDETFSPEMLGLSVVVDYRRQEVTIGREIPDEPADFKLPLRMYRLPFVRGLVNARYPGPFVVDTGGESISISKDIATQLAMRPARRIALRAWGVMGIDPDAYVLPGVNLDFESIQYANFGVAVLNLRAPSVLLGFQLGGTLGYTFLSDYRVGMDFGRGELRLRKLAPVPAGAVGH
jgi:predicted aspartyl protease